jgi:hypothetical protein
MADGTALDGYWLPTISGGALEIQERAFGPGHLPVAIPLFTPHTLREMLVGLRQNREAYLAECPVAEILKAIESAARMVSQPGGRYHGELVETLPDLTGYSKRMIEVGLERMSEGWTAESLRVALTGEFGALEVLDDFQPRSGGGYQRAFGAPLAIHFFSGNIPGVAVSSLIRALCVKSASFGKTAAGEPYFAVCFARALAEHDEALARCLAVSYWPGGSEDLEAVAFSEAGAVIAYGSDEAVASIGCRVPPHVRFIGYPNRVGAALVAKSVLADDTSVELARKAALDVVTFDQQGCVSPHIIYAERRGEVDPLEFAHMLAGALDELSVQIPRGTMAPAESSLIHQLRAQAEIRGATVLSSEHGTEWTVIVEDRHEFDPSPLNRVIQVRPLEDLADALPSLEQVGGQLQTVAIAAAPDEVKPLAGRLGAIGATRLVPVGEAAWPTPRWHHDGRFQFLDLVHFVDLETDTIDDRQ